MKKFDYPPVWLLGFLLATAALWYMFPGIAFHFAGHGGVALVIFAAGFGLVLLALGEMRRAKTTIEPRREPDALVISGVFRYSRNPIYLGGLVILAAGVMYWGSYLALPLLWLYVRAINVRFIDGEEAMMREHFGDAFERYAAATRRWI